METIVVKAAMSHFRTEYAKLRRHRVLTVASLAPVAGLAAALLDLLHIRVSGVHDGRILWKTVYMAVWMPWIAVMLPLLACFYITAVMNIEHSGNQWKQLLTWPAPLWGLFASKMFYSACLAGLSTAIYGLGWALIWIAFSDGGMGMSLLPMASAAAQAWLASCLMVAPQAWLSAKIRGTGRPLLVGMMCLVAGILLFDPSSRMSYAWPWTLCLSTGRFFSGRHDASLPALTGGLGSLAAGTLVCLCLAGGSRRRLAQ